MAGKLQLIIGWLKQSRLEVQTRITTPESWMSKLTEGIWQKGFDRRDLYLECKRNLTKLSFAWHVTSKTMKHVNSSTIFIPTVLQISPTYLLDSVSSTKTVNYLSLEYCIDYIVFVLVDWALGSNPNMANFTFHLYRIDKLHTNQRLGVETYSVSISVFIFVSNFYIFSQNS